MDNPSPTPKAPKTPATPPTTPKSAASTKNDPILTAVGMFMKEQGLQIKARFEALDARIDAIEKAQPDAPNDNNPLLRAVGTLLREYFAENKARFDAFDARITAIEKAQPDAIYKAASTRRLNDAKQALEGYATEFQHRRASVLAGSPPAIIAEALR